MSYDLQDRCREPGYNNVLKKADGCLMVMNKNKHAFVNNDLGANPNPCSWECHFRRRPFVSVCELSVTQTNVIS